MPPRLSVSCAARSLLRGGPPSLHWTAHRSSNQLSGGRSAAVSARWTRSVTAACAATTARQQPKSLWVMTHMIVREEIVDKGTTSWYCAFHANYFHLNQSPLPREQRGRRKERNDEQHSDRSS